MIIINGLEAKRYRVTEAGMHTLQQQLHDLKKQRMEVAGELREISSQSNTASALEDSTFSVDQNIAIEMDGQIDLLERIIGLAEIITLPKATDTVVMGCTVQLAMHNKERQYQLVGAVEANPSLGMISDESPLGQSLLGKRAGDTVAIPGHGEVANATIVAIT